MVTADDVEAELARIQYTLKPLDIVVVNTAAGKRYGQDDYVSYGCGMGHDATMYLLERGVRVTGIDGWSWDAPFEYTRERYEATGDASLIWEGHKAGREIGTATSKMHNRSAAIARFHDLVFPAQNSRRLSRVDPRSRDYRRLTTRTSLSLSQGDRVIGSPIEV